MKHFTKYPKTPITASRKNWQKYIGYSVYECDPDYDYEEVECVEGRFKTVDEAIEFAKSCDFPTHVVFVPTMDPDDDEEFSEWIDDNCDYEPYEVIWESWE